MFLGLRSVIHPAPDLAAAKAWWSGVLGAEPYFDEPFYVGFSVGGYELGLSPAQTAPPTAHWGVADLDRALEALLAAGATLAEPAREVGGGIRVGSVVDPQGQPVALIENPHFAAEPVTSPGPGR